MFKYEKVLLYPVNVKNKNIAIAKQIVTQYGGPAGQLGAALEYFNQRYEMPDAKGEALLTDIATEELGHVEMLCTLLTKLLKDATPEEMKKAGLASHYAEHKTSLYPVDANGVPFTVTFKTSGDALADLTDDMAAEEAARITYENLIDLTDDKDIIYILLYLRQREVVHYHRFKELYDYYKEKGYES